MFLQMGIFNIAQYDSFVFYANAIKSVMAAGHDPRIRKHVQSQLWNRTFPGLHYNVKGFATLYTFIYLCKYQFSSLDSIICTNYCSRY